MYQTVAIQGIKGSFHHQAARECFGLDCTVTECLTFTDLVETVLSGVAGYGIMAVENSLVGAILPNYGLIRESSLTIIGEVYLRIEQNLLALPGQSVDEIKEVYSHPMALQQCGVFLSMLKDVRVVASDDTALSAKQVAEKGQKGVAAIASMDAAREYGLEVVQSGIESYKDNFTRFVALTQNPNVACSHMANKASIAFALPPKPGSLQKALQVFSRYGMNLTMLHSLPQVGQCWEYFFHADLVFRHIDDLNLGLQSLNRCTTFTKVMGIYHSESLNNNSTTT
ncbi:MAG TPA: prephenate dehydratase [Tenuifilaceae bacterium]|nr:prephenate dehydratase [Tenuifilaceae bacterium]